jgi:hypothetical protein
MKKILLLASLFIFAATAAQAQCEKKYKLKTERVFAVQSDGSEGEELPFTVDITLLKDSILLNIVTPDGAAIEIAGKHSEKVCKMNADYTEGTIEWKTDAMMNANGQSRDAKMLFKLESKEGKFKLYGYPEESPDEKICFQVKEKEEIK